MKATHLLAVAACFFFGGLAASQQDESSKSGLQLGGSEPAAAVVELPRLVPAAVAPAQFAPVPTAPAQPAKAGEQPGQSESTAVKPAPTTVNKAQPPPVVVRPTPMPPPIDGADDDCACYGAIDECCEDCCCCCCAGGFWLSGDVLFWWIRPGPLGFHPSTIGLPSRRALFGRDSIDYDAFVGFRLDGGWWLNAERTLGLNINGFLLEQRVVGAQVESQYPAGFSVLTYSVSETALDAPPKGKGKAKGKGPVGNPKFAALESVQEIYYSTSLSGSLTALSASQLGGVELNGVVRMVHRPRLSLDLLGGFRYLDLDEDLFLTHESISLVPDQLYYVGDPQPAGSTVIVNDLFWTHNRFYGGQVGAKADWTCGCFIVGLAGKMALGSTQQVIRVKDDATLITPGGVLAAFSNQGRHQDWRFAVVPELNVNLGWQVTPRLRLNVGYTYLYWSTVQRPGNVLDRAADGVVRGDSLFGGSDYSRPTIVPRRTAFWTQGVNVGLEFQF